MSVSTECRTLAEELARGGIAATVDSDQVAVEATQNGRYRRLLLSPDPRAKSVDWVLVDGHDDELEEGFWPASVAVPRSGVRHADQGTPVVLRNTLHAYGATVGAPATPSFADIIGEQSNSWMEVFGLAADHCAEALADGTVPTTVRPEDLARLHPELTAERNMLHSDGWGDGIQIIRALAHGHVSDDHRPHPCACANRLTISCDTLADYGPPGLAVLQAGFGGDVRAAARAFLARAIPGQNH